MTDNKKTLWQQLRVKYRVAVVNESSLGEVLHMHLSLWNLILVIIALTVLTLVMFALVIWFTPLKNYLPGYNATIREELVSETMRMDSLLNMMRVQQDYVSVIRDIAAGGVESDSIPDLDSLYLVKLEDMKLEASEQTAQFISEYEAAERENLNVFDKATSNDYLPVLSCPVQGVICEPFAETNYYQGVRVQAPAHAHVSAVLSGTVLSVAYSVQHQWMVILLHDGDYVSTYGWLEKPMCRVGDKVKAGSVLGLAGDKPVGLQIWQQGHAVNPESVIAF
ncbi:MAG: M23 family metallopeptidase [Paludibacteraceae bacterium]|nr:M23 family metallopeptidase [Paludibacteraceae bacterium]